MIDVDGSKTIDRAETLKFWSKNFPGLNTNELFDQVDKNNDGSIQIDEWIEFWTIVYNSGHSEEEITAEVFRYIYFQLDNLIAGGAWVKFEHVDTAKGKKSNLKKEGKYQISIIIYIFDIHILY